MIDNKNFEGGENKEGNTGSPNAQPLFVRIGKHAAIGLEFPSAVIGGMLLGYALDSHFGTSPWFAISLTLLGFLGGCIRLVQLVKRFLQDKQ